MTILHKFPHFSGSFSSLYPFFFILLIVNVIFKVGAPHCLQFSQLTVNHCWYSVCDSAVIHCELFIFKFTHLANRTSKACRKKADCFRLSVKKNRRFNFFALKLHKVMAKDNQCLMLHIVLNSCQTNMARNTFTCSVIIYWSSPMLNGTKGGSLIPMQHTQFSKEWTQMQDSVTENKPFI